MSKEPSKRALALALREIRRPPFETRELITGLERFLRTKFTDTVSGTDRDIGSCKWGVYAFYDYDRQPIYVGQTYERLSSRIRRHLTNQRTDPVAMSVLDPFEVFEIAAWPLPQFEEITKAHSEFAPARMHLDALERRIHDMVVQESSIKQILNEKNPPEARTTVTPPEPVKAQIVSQAVADIRSHPDVRIARRTLVMSQLAQVIAERELMKKEGGLRRVLIVQAERVLLLAQRRFIEVGGERTVVSGSENDDPS